MQLDIPNTGQRFIEDLRTFKKRTGSIANFILITSHVGRMITYVVVSAEHSIHGHHRVDFSSQSLELPMGGEIQYSPEIKKIIEHIRHTTRVLASSVQ